MPYAYTRPSPARYPWQWYWDSCFAAIVWRRLEPRALPRPSSRRCCGRCAPDGFVGHVVFWDRPISLRRRAYYNVASRAAEMTGTIQPPLLAWAWRLAVGDPAAEPRIAAHHQWLRANRDLEGDGLLWLIQPDESGLDSSPKFDPVWGRRSHANWAFPLLVARNRRLGWDARRIRDARRARAVRGDDQRALVPGAGRDRRAVDHAGARRSPLGRAARATSSTRRSPEALRPAINTWAALAPLALPDLPEAIGRRMVEEHLLDPKRFWLRYPPASVAADEPSLRARPRARVEAPLLARADLGQRRLAPVARPQAARLRAEAEHMAARSRRRSSARACASTTTRTPARALAQPTSPGAP